MKAEKKSAQRQYYKRKEIQKRYAETMRNLFNADEFDEQEEKLYIIGHQKTVHYRDANQS